MPSEPLDYDDLFSKHDRCLVSENDNLSPLSELELVMENAGDLPFYPLYASLRFSAHEEDVNGEIYEVGVKKATLFVETSGYTVDQKNRFSDVQMAHKTSEVQRTATKEKTSKASLEGEAQAQLTPVGPKGGVSLKGGVSTDIKTSFTATEKHQHTEHFVKVATGERWIFGYPNSKESMDQLAIGTETLCRLIPVKGANSSSVTVYLSVLPRDFIFRKVSENSKFWRMTDKVNDEKLLKAFATKRIRESQRVQNEDSRIHLSVSYIADHHD
ncbi:MAG: hypothetical protein COA43_05995 [Robiginitomaculum sp.]|nr:MAG: hypothetical protein COA43_05995 [Robiginitomaculum sp.]